MNKRMHRNAAAAVFETDSLPAASGDAGRSSSNAIMTGSEFSTTLIRARRWAGVVYFVSAVTLMLLICGVGYIWFPEFQKLTLVFRDQRKAIRDDGTYGAIVGLLISAFFVVPSMVLPLWFVVIVDRRLGTSCSVCGSSLTLWKRGNIVLRTGKCVKCLAAVVESARDVSEDEQGGAPERANQPVYNGTSPAPAR